MSSQICSVCLAGNRELHSIDDIEIKSLYWKLVTIEANTVGDARRLCYVCHWQLQRCRRFAYMARRANHILTDLYHRGYAANQETLRILNIKTIQDLCISTVTRLTIHDQDEINDLTIKEEKVDISIVTNEECEEAVKQETYDGIIENHEIYFVDNDVTEAEELIDKPLDVDSNSGKSKIDLYNYDVRYENPNKTELQRTKRAKKIDSPFSCSLCSVSFSFKYDLQNHFETHGQIRERFPCNMCHKTFRNKNNLLIHKKSHEKDFTCQICYKSYKNKCFLEKHRVSHCPEQGPFICDNCGKTFTEKGGLKKHIMRIHNRENMQDNPEAYACKTCKKTFKREKNLRFHMSTHKKFPCDKCDQSFDKHSLKIHKKTHNTIQYPCNQCSKTFNESINLKNHLKMHSGDKPYSCEHCNKSFTLPMYLKRHIKRHSTESAGQTYSCSQCNKTYRGRASLLQHIRTHRVKIYTHTCDRCAKVFTNYTSLRKHMVIHTGEKPYVCTLCGKSFARSCNLNEHLRVHTGEKPFACTICNKTFTQSSSLSGHRRVHSGVRSFACEVCGKTFNDKYTLKKHVWIHTGEKPYACSSCEQTFRYNSSLHDHVRKHHSKEKITCDKCCKIFNRPSHLKRHMKIHLRENQSFSSPLKA